MRFITYKGETRTIPEWTEKLGLGKETIRERLKRGWSESEVIEGKGGGQMKLYPYQQNVLEITKNQNRVAYYMDMGL